MVRFSWMKALALSVVVLGIAGIASAAVLPALTASITEEPTNWDETLSVPQFDPSVGQLTGISISITGNVSGLAAYESWNATPAVITVDLSALILLERASDNSPIWSVSPMVSSTGSATAFDGEYDFDGTSGQTFAGLFGTDSGTIELTSAADLAMFTGNGTVDLNVLAKGASSGSGAGNLDLRFRTSASADIVVEYNYVPEPATMSLLALGGLAFIRRRRA